MKSTKDPIETAAELRARAEAAFQAKAAASPETQTATLETTRALLHELQVHQIELEMQNEELRRSRLELEVSRASYFDLYDLAPVGYCTVGANGVISEANLTLATLLGVARGALVVQLFSSFILKADEDVFYLLKRKILAAHATGADPAAPSCSCELRLKRGDGTPVWVGLVVTAATGESGETVLRVVVTDISARRASEAIGLEKAQIQVAILNAIPAHVALIDPEGVILATNESWRRFATATLLQGPEFSLGQNYQKVCERATGPCSEEARDVAAGIRRVLRGEAGEFTIEYPCHSPTEQRWFRLMATPLHEGIGGGAVVMHLDITARKLVEVKLAQTAEMVERTGELAKVGGWSVDLTTKKLTWTRETFRISELETLEEPALEDAINLFAPEARPVIAAAVQAAIATGTPYDLELPLITAKGNHRWVQTQGFAEMQDGQAVRIYGTFQDISARKEAEQKLAASERRLRAIIEAEPECVKLLGPDCTLMEMNPAGLRMMEAESIDEIIGHSVLGLVLPEHRAAFAGLAEHVQQGGSGVLEFEIQGLKGTRRWLETRAVPLPDAAGRGLSLLGITRDITARKAAELELRESEERFRQLAENIQEVFWITDPAKNQMLYISPAYEKIWGRTCAQLYQHPRSWQEAIHPEDRPRIQHATETKQLLGLFDETYRIQRPDGGERWIHDQAFPVTGPTGKVQRIVGTAEDITERVVLEEQVRQSQKLQTIGTLAAGIAHDFNNILAAILGNAELALLDTAPEHPAHECLEGIRAASDRAKNLVLQILAFSSQQPMERHSLALGPVVVEVARLLRATIPTGVRIDTSVDPDVPPVVGNATEMHQVLMNLCTNAWHALGDRPGRIEVTLRSATLTAEEASRIAGLKPGRFACLSVRDNGKGMDAATLKRIFDPFFTTKEPGKGTGLGLSVVHGIVRGYQGAIQVVSQPGEGATFTLYFPAAGTAPGVAAPGVTATAIRDASRHILYLDDDGALLATAQRTLERLGYRVTGFVRPADALKAFRDNPGQFDLAVTDMNMPVVTGLFVAQELLRIRADLPIVLISGNIDKAVQQAARTAGIRGILCKPVTMVELDEAIRRLTPRP